MPTYTIEEHEMPGLIDRITSEVVSEIQGTDFSEAMRDCAGVLRESHSQFFATETGPSGERWEPWHWRPVDAPANHKTLHITGALESSVLGGADHVENITPDSLEWGTSKHYAGLHQEGGESIVGVGMVNRSGTGYMRPGTKITVPQREFVGLNEKSIEQVVNVIADAAVENVKG